MKSLRLVLVLLCSLAFGAWGSNKPNFIIFLADDCSYCDIHCWGNPDVKTPNLDKLASEGMKLTRCYTPAPVCSPTRMALYTGLYPVKNGAYPNHSAVNPGTRSMVHFLQAHGYRVGIVGKTMIGPADSFPFDEPRSAANQKRSQKEKAWKKAAKKSKDDEAEDDADLDFAAIDAYTKNKEQPFCLVVGSHQPHGPWNKGDAAAYDPKKITMPPYLVDTPKTREQRCHYLAEITFLDAEVGRVIKMLDENGQSENTLFLFLSEQGSGFPGGKYNLYDVGIRSAAIARWPGKIKPGSLSDALCSYVDVIPTFIEAAGGKPVPGLDGRSFLNVLMGKSKKHLDYVFAQSTSLGVNGVKTPYGIRAVRNDRYKYILNLNHENEFPCSWAAHNDSLGWLTKAKTDVVTRDYLQRFLHRPEVELYDLKRDPWEQNNLASDPAYHKQLVQLREALKEWMQQQGDRGVQTELEAKEHLKKVVEGRSKQGANTDRKAKRNKKQ